MILFWNPKSAVTFGQFSYENFFILNKFLKYKLTGLIKCGLTINVMISALSIIKIKSFMINVNSFAMTFGSIPSIVLI